MREKAAEPNPAAPGELTEDEDEEEEEEGDAWFASEL